jgi:hypothetical protein
MLYELRLDGLLTAARVNELAVKRYEQFVLELELV